MTRLFTTEHLLVSRLLEGGLRRKSVWLSLELSTRFFEGHCRASNVYQRLQQKTLAWTRALQLWSPVERVARLRGRTQTEPVSIHKRVSIKDAKVKQYHHGSAKCDPSKDKDPPSFHGCGRRVARALSLTMQTLSHKAFRKHRLESLV